MYLYDIVDDRKQFNIEATSFKLNLSNYKYFDNYVVSDELLPAKFSSVRMTYKLIREVDQAYILETLEDFVKNNSYKKVFFHSNYLTDKKLKDLLFSLKKRLKFHFDTTSNTFKITKSGFFKGKSTQLNLIRYSGKLYLFNLIDCDNVSRLEMFDYKKPFREQKQGMMPPKLAWFMINIFNEAKCLFDPFCGTGTTLMLCNLLGMNSKGSDILPENITGTNQNIDYICNKLSLENKVESVDCIDALKLTSKDLDGVDFICTEGFLGKPKSGKESAKDIITEVNNLSDFYIKFFKNLSEVKNQPLTVVITFPVVKSSGKLYFLNKLFDKLSETGFRQVNLSNKNKDYLYKRADQKVLRQVVMLKST